MFGEIWRTVRVCMEQLAIYGCVGGLEMCVLGCFCVLGLCLGFFWVYKLLLSDLFLNVFGGGWRVR